MCEREYGIYGSSKQERKMDETESRKNKKHRTYMNIAHEIASLSTCGRKNVGAVVVSNDRVASVGYNGAPGGSKHCDDVGHLMHKGSCLRAVHAEQNAIAFAGRQDLHDARIYVTVRPCLRCLNTAINAGVSAIYYDEEYDHPTDEEATKIADEADVDLEQIDEVLG